MSKDTVSTPLHTGLSDNIIQPFQLESSHLRGRLVTLGSVINDVLEPHGYPNPVAHLVAETMGLTLLLSSMLKYEGIFTLQARGDGPISMLVADVTSNGDVRACATYDDERLQKAREPISALKTVEGSQNHLAQYLGHGHLAFTVDQKGAEDRYQGIVELKGSSLTDCVQHYFSQSEQIGTGIKMAAGQRGGQWRVGAIMLQHLPEDAKNPEAGQGNTRTDDWRRAMMFLDTCTEDEFLDVEITPSALLTRLFHEEGVRIFDPLPVQAKCRCSEDRVKNIIRTLPEEDRTHIIQDGKITVNCEFCSRNFTFEPDDIPVTLQG